MVLPLVSFAQASAGIEDPLKNIDSGGISGIVVIILGYVVKIGAVIAIFFFIYSGFLYVKAQGNSEELKKAHSAFLNTVIGTAILLGAQLIATIIVGTISNIK